MTDYTEYEAKGWIDSPALLRDLYGFVGRLNLGAWRGFGTRELLLVGLDAVIGESGWWRASFRFRQKPTWDLFLPEGQPIWIYQDIDFTMLDHQNVCGKLKKVEV